MANHKSVKRKVAIASGVALLAFTVLAPTAGYLLSKDATAADQVSANAADPLASLTGRSPGERLYGIATKAKQRALGFVAPVEPESVAALPDPMGDGDDLFDPVPTQRALGQIFDEPLPPQNFVPPPATSSGGSSGDFPPSSSGGSTGGSGGSSGGSTGGSSGGSTGGTSGTTGGTSGSTGGTSGSTSGSTSGFPPPVPEPSTWAMMILGFGLIGSAMRRRKKTVFSQAAA